MHTENFQPTSALTRSISLNKRKVNSAKTFSVLVRAVSKVIDRIIQRVLAEIMRLVIATMNPRVLSTVLLKMIRMLLQQ